MDFLSGHISTFIKAKESYHEQKQLMSYKIKRAISYVFFWTGKRFGNYLVILYIFCKLLYLLNVFGQLFLMTRLLGIENYHYLGFEILSRMAKGADMISGHYFPKVTHCDFKIRELGDDHQYTVQCVLSINIFTEKIYIILWFWYVILSVITIIDLFTFIIRNCLPNQRYNYIRKHVLIFSKIEDKEDLKHLKKFTQNYLRPDLILVLKLLATNVNAMVVSELTKRLWDKYLRVLKKKQKINQLDDDESVTPGFPSKRLNSLNIDDDDDNDNDDVFNKVNTNLYSNTNKNDDNEVKQLMAIENKSPTNSNSKLQRQPSNS